jgi:hypothetical protein
MSLFESASLVVTPNGTKASKLYAIKPTSGAGDLSVTRATTATRVNSAGLIESVAVNVPRLDYTNSTCPSILIEPQRTNLVLRSQEIDNSSWSKDNNGTGVSPVVTANYTTAPDGTNTADRVQFSNIGKTLTTDYSLIVQYPITLGGTGTFTIYLKSNTSSNQNVLCYWGAGEGTVFNVTTQWQRFTLPNLTSGLAGIVIGSRGGFGFTAGGDETLDISVWGAQLEAGSYATSYIPTTTATVTRNADVINKTSVSSLIGQTEGTIYSEIKVSKLLGTASRYIFHLSDGTANNRIYMAFSGASSNILRGRIFNGGTLQCSIDSSTISATGTYKLALAYKNNDIVFYINGVQIGTDTSATIPTCSRVDLGHNYAGASQFNDSINNANVWKTRLSNSELATLTTL